MHEKFGGDRPRGSKDICMDRQTHKHTHARAHTRTHTHGRFNGLFSRTTWVGRYQKDKPFSILLKQRWWGGSGIRWTICKSFTLCSRQITMPAPHHLSFYGPDALPAAQPTVSKHWRKPWTDAQLMHNLKLNIGLVASTSSWSNEVLA